MKKARITISFRQTIDVLSEGSFEKNVFEDSYREFLLQSQAYNPSQRFSTFADMVDNNPKANSLHYKTGFAVGLYINGLKKRIPRLKDTQDRSLNFASHRFELISSDINNKSDHKVAITYYSAEYYLLATIGNNLLIAPVLLSEYGNNESFLIALQENVSISSFEEVELEPAI